MAFNTQELEIIRYGVQNGKSRQEVEGALARLRSGVKPVAPKVERPGFVGRVGEELGSSFKGLQETTERGAELIQEGKPVQGAVMSGLGAVGGLIRGAFSPITAAIAPVIQSAVKESGALENEKVQSVLADFDTWAKENPDLAKNSQNVIEILTTLVGAKGVTSALPALKEGAKSTVEGITTSVARVAESPLVQGIEGATRSATEGVARIPARVATNVAERQATSKAISELPSDVARTAVRDGLDINDVKSLYQIPKTIKPQAKELVDTVKRFAAGDKSVDPIEAVGKPIVARLKELDSLKGTIGQKLGVVAESLGTVTTKEVYPSVFANLKKIPGLNGLTVSSKGVLNFENTVLATAATKSDRAAIQRIFTDAIKNGTGKQKHLLRQELFEVLGGKKKAGVQLTDTQAKAFEAIRKGLSDVLDSKNPEYKALNMEFAKVVQPLNDMRKAMRVAHGATEDILDMNAGLLARRLTSTSLSQGQIRTILGALDNATAVKGNVLETTEGLQNLYNILNKTYNLAPATGFEGSIKTATLSGGFIDRIVKALGGVAGETPAVREKALEKILQEILEVTPIQTTKTTNAIKSSTISPKPTIQSPKAQGVATPKTATTPSVFKRSEFTSLEEAMSAASSAKTFIDDIASRVANETGNTVSVAPIKKLSRIVEKMKEPDIAGDFNNINDIARNAIVLDNPASYQNIVDLIKKGNKNIKVKEQKPENYMGYEGTIINLRTPSGLNAEIQIVSPKMIYGKFPLEDATRILGKETVDKLRTETGVETGLWHKIYEEYRVMTPEERLTPAGLKLLKDSVDYYAKLR